MTGNTSSPNYDWIAGKQSWLSHRIPNIRRQSSETKTLIPVLETFQKKFDIDKPIIVEDAALLSQKNIDALQKNHYKYILGGRLKNKTEAIKTKVIEPGVEEGSPPELSSLKFSFLLGSGHIQNNSQKSVINTNSSIF